MAIAGTDGIGLVIDALAVVALGMDSIELSSRCRHDVLAYTTIGGSWANSGCLSLWEPTRSLPAGSPGGSGK